ncbi:hypothetical protein HOK021_28180 [Streptomyces hygroscopicus]|nr:hypothetical protein HOK021_28180 [Streptomyces hygroscopicus]
MTAEGVRSGEVEHPGPAGHRELAQRGGQVFDMHRAADVVGEQDAVVRVGSQGVDARRRPRAAGFTAGTCGRPPTAAPSTP